MIHVGDEHPISLLGVFTPMYRGFDLYAARCSARRKLHGAGSMQWDVCLSAELNCGRWDGKLGMRRHVKYLLYVYVYIYIYAYIYIYVYIYSTYCIYTILYIS